MDVSLFHEFIEVVKHGSFRKASLAMHIDPSTLSRHIDHLEEELDSQLFERENGRRTFELTSNGHYLLKRATIIWSTYQQCSLHLTSNEWDGVLRICGSQETIMHTMLIDSVLSEFAKQGYGDCVFLPKPIARGVEVVDEVLSGRADCALGFEFSGNPLVRLHEESLTTVGISTFPLYAVVISGEFPQADDTLTFESLNGVNFMQPGNQRFSTTWEKTRRILDNRGIIYTCDPILHTTSRNTEHRTTVAVLPMDSLELQLLLNRGKYVKKISDPDAFLRLEFLHRKQDANLQIELMKNLFNKHIDSYKTSIIPKPKEA